MERYIPRREFLKYTLALLIGTGLQAAHIKVPASEKSKKALTIDDYVNTVIKIESNGNPQAERYEQHLQDTSYGLGQLLTSTAKDLEKRCSYLPRLGNNQESIKRNLCDPEINRSYTKALFKEELDFYKDPSLAVAAYNSGHFTPRNARCQQQLNDIYKTNLKTDGILGQESIKTLKKFQKDNKLMIDGKLGRITYLKLQQFWKNKHSNKSNPTGIIPQNNYTPNHVEKFKNALKTI